MKTGRVGTINCIDTDEARVKMDVLIDGAEYWDNEVIFYSNEVELEGEDGYLTPQEQVDMHYTLLGVEEKAIVNIRNEEEVYGNRNEL